MSFRKSLYSFLLSAVVVVTAVQYPFDSFQGGAAHVATPFDPFDAGLFTPLEHMSRLTTDEFTTLTHPAFPRHRVRMKKADWCDPAVKYVSWITAF